MDSPSMEPTFKQGSLIEIDRDAFEGGDIPLWSVVAFQDEFGGKPFTRILRMAALPGERVSLNPHGIRVNGSMRNPPFLPKGTYAFFPQVTPKEYYNTPFIIPEDHYFLIGDNPLAARDSRHFGPVAVTRIFGAPLRR